MALLMVNEDGTAQLENLPCVATENCKFREVLSQLHRAWLCCLEQHVTESENPYVAMPWRSRCAFKQSGCLGMQPKMGGKLHLKLNTGTRPITNKYPEGKMKRTLKRELKTRDEAYMGVEHVRRASGERASASFGDG